MERMNKNRKEIPEIFAPFRGIPLLTLRALLCYSIVTIKYGSVKLEESGETNWPKNIT